MRIRILSDLHREFGLTEIPAVGGDMDLVVLAGDIDIKMNALGCIREFTAGVPAAYVCGDAGTARKGMGLLGSGG